MNWLANWRRRTQIPHAVAGAPPSLALQKWLSLPDTPLDLPHFETRYVVVNTAVRPAPGDEALKTGDTEATLEALVAVSVEQLSLRAGEAQLVTAPHRDVTALTDYLCWIGQAPIVVFNAGINRLGLEHCCSALLDLNLPWAWIDLYELLPKLFPEYRLDSGRLREWATVFELEPPPLPQVLGDAYLIAQLLLIALARAQRNDCTTPQALLELVRNARLEHTL